MRVDENSGGGMKNPDQILARGGVDRGLPPNRGIDHRDQSGGYLDDRNTTHEGSGEKAGEVTNDAPSERDYDRVPAESFGEHLVGQARPGFAAFVGLAGGYREHFE